MACVSAFVGCAMTNKETPLCFTSEYVKIPIAESLFNYVLTCGDCKLIGDNWQNKIQLVCGGKVNDIAHELQVIEAIISNGFKRP